MRTRECRRIALVVMLFTMMVCLSYGSSREAASAAFQKLQSLAGNWEGQDEQGKRVKSTFEPIVSDTAVMETLTMPEMHEMLTLYSVDIDSIVLMHYCPANNQPRMRAAPSSIAIKELVFSFQGAGNLPNLALGHEHKLVIQFENQDHITEHWTWRRDGKDTEMVFHLARTGSESKRIPKERKRKNDRLVRSNHCVHQDATPNHQRH
jgi:anion-transporting  ArsA/GET3 family ATPase